MPGVGALVHGVQVEGGLNLGLSSRQELKDMKGEFSEEGKKIQLRFLCVLGHGQGCELKCSGNVYLTMIPGTAGGTRLFSMFKVYSATCSGVALSLHSAPGVTMLGFRRIPSKSTLFSAKK